MTENSFSTMLDAFDTLQSSGGGYVGLIHMSVGWKVYPAGVQTTLEDTFFAYDPTSKASVKEAGDKAKAAVAKNGWVNKKGEKAAPVPVLTIQLKKDEELTGRMVNWTSEEQYWSVAKFGPGYEQILRPSLSLFKEANIDPSNGWIWAHIGFQPDPSGLEKTNKKTGAVTPVFVPFIAAILGSKSEAEKYVKENSLERDDSSPSTVTHTETADLPTGYTKKVWESVARDIHSSIEKGMSKDDAAKDFDLEIKWIDVALSMK